MIGMYFSMLKKARLFFGTNLSKSEWMKSREKNKKITLHVLPAVLQGVKSGLLSRRQEITPDFRKEYPTTQLANMMRSWDTPPGQNREQRSGGEDSGGRDNRGMPTGQLRFTINDRIRQTITLILKRFQGRLNINSLFIHANTSAARTLGPQHQNTCLRALIA